MCLSDEILMPFCVKDYPLKYGIVVLSPEGTLTEEVSPCGLDKQLALGDRIRDLEHLEV